MMQRDNKVALLILDGWGMTTQEEKSAPAIAQTPYIDALYKEVPWCVLAASEEAVGLPKGQVGNSEVGHSTLGTGRVNWQNLVRIEQAIHDRSFFSHPCLLEEIAYAKKYNKSIHLVGLLSDGGVHSHIDHLFAAIDLLIAHHQPFFVHGITDGRDTDPSSGLQFIIRLQQKLQKSKGCIASLIGRYFAMDRDQRWERVQEAYRLYTQGIGSFYADPLVALQVMYENNITDEFLPPIVCLENNQGILHADDVLFCLNFRSDRVRELISCLTQHAYPEFDLVPLGQLHTICMTTYDPTFTGVEVLFPSISLENSLGAILSDSQKTQLRIAETEKYPHVTYFLNGGRENPYVGETRMMIPSPKVATYNLQPAMSAYEVTEACITYLEQHTPDFICLNYANPDMVGHTGVFSAVIEACEVVDRCLVKLADCLVAQGYQLLILADHGNADYMLNDDGSSNTAHSLALVPCFLVNGPPGVVLHKGSLADVAPTILALFGLKQPKEMTGISLL